jgi:hypothetical protein
VNYIRDDEDTRCTRKVLCYVWSTNNWILGLLLLPLLKMGKLSLTSQSRHNCSIWHQSEAQDILLERQWKLGLPCDNSHGQQIWLQSTYQQSSQNIVNNCFNRSSPSFPPKSIETGVQQSMIVMKHHIWWTVQVSLLTSNNWIGKMILKILDYSVRSLEQSLATYILWWHLQFPNSYRASFNKFL